MTVLDVAPDELPPHPESPGTQWRQRFGPGTVIGLFTAGIAFDVAARHPIDSVAGFVLVLALVVIGSRGHAGVGRMAVLTALVPASFLLVRDTPWLSTLNVWAALGLIAIGSTLRPEVDALRLNVTDLIRRFFRPLGALTLLPRLVGALVDALGLRRRSVIARAVPAARGLVFSLPFLAVLLLLLAGADPVFASFFEFPVAGDEVVGHLLRILLGLILAGVVQAEVSRTDGPRPTEHRRFLDAPEQIALLGGSVLIYAGFLAAQLAALLGGADYVLDTTGLTWAEYARSGFFQLLWAAVLTLGILMGGRSYGMELSGVVRRITTGLSLGLVVLTLATVAVSVRRLGLYEQAFGPSMLRLYSSVFALWLGAVFVLVGLDRIGRGLRGRLVAAIATSALATLVAMNVYNPEQRVASGHLERFDGEAVDLGYLIDDLGPDALPAALADPDSLEAACAAQVDDAGGLSWNLGRARAHDALKRFCG